MADSTKYPPKTIIIHQGSTILHIGLATDSEPKVLLNCIARKSTRGRPGKIPEIVKLKPLISFDSELNEEILSSFKSSDDSAHVVLKDELHDIWIQGSSPTKSCSESRIQFVPFIEGFKLCDGDTYELQWPILSGCFNNKFVITENVQSLADMWSYALTKYVCLSLLLLFDLVFFEIQ